MFLFILHLLSLTAALPPTTFNNIDNTANNTPCNNNKNAEDCFSSINASSFTKNSGILTTMEAKHKTHQISSGNMACACTSACTENRHIHLAQSTDDIRSLILKTEVGGSVQHNSETCMSADKSLKVRRPCHTISNTNLHTLVETRLSNSCLNLREIQARGFPMEEPVLSIDYPSGTSAIAGVWTLGLGLLGDSESKNPTKYDVTCIVVSLDIVSPYV